MKKILQSFKKLPFNNEYRRLREQQRITGAHFRNTTGNDTTARHARELAKKSYDTVTDQINKMKEEARIKKIALGRKKKLIT